MGEQHFYCYGRDSVVYFHIVILFIIPPRVKKKKKGFLILNSKPGHAPVVTVWGSVVEWGSVFRYVIILVRWKSMSYKQR